MEQLFAYGTLMCEDIMSSIVGSEQPRIEGILKGYRRLKLQNEYYPAIIEQENCEVKGVVYYGVVESGWRQLDRFEGEMYRRQMVEIQIADGSEINAYTYVLKEQYRGRLSQNEWNFAEFLKNGKRVFMSNYSGYSEID